MVARDGLIPDPLKSRQQYDRYYHHDIPGLNDTTLTDEIHALRPLLWGLDSVHWLRERVKALEAELTVRDEQAQSRAEVEL